ncbi:CaiB/BaiF CoA transferase family protein [Amorphoplanes digitatis]|uniref:Alpha-methylacyl-CoA racemase n=1 Tax=Actinoplanes digitatis TaxID=1868 RepID=A0A7W7HWL9_9ACTN|nr:CaiB/BaiF CoA-transferase family protein [Actinoplanes digitatis]MBB4762102.1 alpha-methylacyl-CoA racemase [Actinoplanes digitatis]
MSGDQGPLRGLKVIELAGIGPAPFAGMLLADLGADVVRVDRVGPGSPLSGDPRYDLLNRGKRSIAADLKRDDDRELVLSLAERADVLIEGYRPGVAERLGVGPEAALARNPALVYARMTGWGQDGPLASSAGHDITYLAITGALHAIGRAGGPPQVPANLLGDFGGGSLYLVVGVLAALREAERTGRGQVVDAAITDGAAHLTTLLYGLSAEGRWRDERGVNILDTGAPFYDVYPAADGGYLAVGALEPQFYAEFIRLLAPGDDLPAQYDLARWPELRARIAAAFETRTQQEWAAVFEGTEACVAPVLSLSEAARHPHLEQRGTFESPGGVRQPAAAPRFSLTPPGPVGRPALPGEHTREVLADWKVTGGVR